MYWAIITCSFFFGAFSLPLYALCSSHAFDRADVADYVSLSAGLMFYFSVGAIVGPIIASNFALLFGYVALFYYVSLVHGGLIAYTLFRMLVRPDRNDAERKPVVGLLRTSPILVRLIHRDNKPKDE